MRLATLLEQAAEQLRHVAGAELTDEEAELFCSAMERASHSFGRSLEAAELIVLQRRELAAGAN